MLNNARAHAAYARKDINPTVQSPRATFMGVSVYFTLFVRNPQSNSTHSYLQNQLFITHVVRAVPHSQATFVTAPRLSLPPRLQHLETAIKLGQECRHYRLVVVTDLG